MAGIVGTEEQATIPGVATAITVEVVKGDGL